MGQVRCRLFTIFTHFFSPTHSSKVPDPVLTEQTEGAASSAPVTAFFLLQCEMHQPKPVCFASYFGIFGEVVANLKCLPEGKETW